MPDKTTSNRNAGSLKAIRHKWKEEQELVKQGKGTRNWTPEQQRDILERGRALDEDDGRSFKGHHMKSVEKHPEYQDDPNNIQFLTQKEHQEAHHGNWKTPSNWYYDPVTKEFTDFGDGPPVPCKIIELSNPIVNVTSLQDESNKFDDNSENSNDKTHSPPSENKEIEKPVPLKKQITSETRESVFHYIRGALNQAKDRVWDFAEEHPIITTLVTSTLGTVIKHGMEYLTVNVGLNNSRPRQTSKGISHQTKGNQSSGLHDNSEAGTVPSDNKTNERPPQTKAPHDTRGYTRIRNGKEEHVKGYSTGKNRNKNNEK